MRILVVSDSHGNEYALRQAIAEQPTTRVLLHLGDGAREAADVAEQFPSLTVYGVRGNCDWGCHDIPENREECFGGKRIFMTHGHIYNVKYGLYTLDCAARERQVDIALFGHTHQPLTDYADGLYLLNPGSLRYSGTYGIVDITPAGIMTNIVHGQF